MHVMYAHAYGCRVSSHAVCLSVCGQQRDVGGGRSLLVWWCTREGRNVTPHVFFMQFPQQSAIAHGACYQSTQTASPCIAHTTHTSTHTRYLRGERSHGGLVAGSATTMRHQFLRKTHAHNFRGVVCIYIQSPKHLQSIVDGRVSPHHQA